MLNRSDLIIKASKERGRSSEHIVSDGEMFRIALYTVTLDAGGVLRSGPFRVQFADPCTFFALS